MEMGQEWEARAAAIPCGARVHLRVKAAAHYKEGVERLFSLSELSKLAFPLVSSSAAPAAPAAPFDVSPSSSEHFSAFVFAMNQQQQRRAGVLKGDNFLSLEIK